ncbi:AAA family ATPase [Chloroflexota bacterium]
MITLYITSPEKGSGKTAVCAGLGKQLLAGGKKTGYFKPIISDTRQTAAQSESNDAEFIKQLFSLSESSDIICPHINSGSNQVESIKQAFSEVSQGKDVVIVEGTSDQYGSSPEIIRALDAKVLIVEGYSKELLTAIDSYSGFGESLLGIVLNKVPVSRLEQTKADASAQLEKAGVSIIGTLPEDRTLLTVTIGELAEHIQGEIISGAGKSAELVENFMLGALTLDPGPDYFGRKTNKAVVLKNERSDMQLAAMETSSRCLVLSGNSPPDPIVLDKAERKNIPVILAKDDVSSLAAGIEDALVNNRFNQQNKMTKLSEIIEQHLNFQAVNQGLGLGE